MPDVFRLKGNGTVDNPFNPDKIGGKIIMDGALASLSDRKFSFLPIPVVPALQLKANVDYHPGKASGKLAVTTRGGRLAADGSWLALPEKYNASISLDNFPVDAFMPSLGVGNITAHTTLNGKGYNPMSKDTSVDADVRLSQVTYLNETYRDINLNTSLHVGEATGTLVSHNPGADATINLDARLYNDSVLYNINGRPATASFSGTTAAMGILGLYYLFQIAVYSLIGYSFSSPEGRRQWVQGFAASSAIAGLALAAPALLIVCRPEWTTPMLWLSAAIYAASRAVFVVKGFKIFYHKLRSLLYFILYLCTLEIIPVLLIYRLLCVLTVVV